MKTFWSIVILTAMLSAPCLSAQTPKPIDIGSQLEMFVDRYLIAEMRGDVRLMLHEPHDEGSVLIFDDTWDGRWSGYATMIHDGAKYQFYYRGLPRDVDADENRPEVTCYAESADGIHWSKPNLGLFEVDGSKKNNVILAGPRPFSHNFCPFVDTNPDTDTDRRYKALAGGSTTGLMAYVSADGIRWHKLQEEPVIPWKEGVLGLDSQNVAFWSEHEQQYVAYVRETPYLPDGSYVRAVARVTSKDFIHWSEPKLMTYSDTGTVYPSIDLYTNQTSPYFRAPHVYLATAARFMPGRQVITEAEAQRLEVNPTWLRDTSDAILLTSRGGNHYDRTHMGALIKPGIGLMNWTSRTNYPALNIVQTGDTEMSLYVTQDYAQPTAHLRRYSMRLDGIASVHAEYDGGELVTKPLIFEGDRLLLNFATSAAGGIYVEIQNAEGKPIPGFTLEDSVEVIGNEIERAVAWKDGGDLSQLIGKPVRLRFVMHDTDLYALRFQ